MHEQTAHLIPPTRPVSGLAPGGGATNAAQRIQENGRKRRGGELQRHVRRGQCEVDGTRRGSTALKAGGACRIGNSSHPAAAAYTPQRLPARPCPCHAGGARRGARTSALAYWVVRRTGVHGRIERDRAACESRQVELHRHRRSGGVPPLPAFPDDSTRTENVAPSVRPRPFVHGCAGFRNGARRSRAGPRRIGRGNAGAAFRADERSTGRADRRTRRQTGLASKACRCRRGATPLNLFNQGGDIRDDALLPVRTMPTGASLSPLQGGIRREPPGAAPSTSRGSPK